MKKSEKSCERCGWCGTEQLYVEYHDAEWGVPVYDDQTIFEFLTLEAAQAGLSWLTVLKKREGYRRAFADFEPEKVARFTEGKIAKLLTDPGIVRNRLKVNAAVNNAKLFLETAEKHGTFSKFMWDFVDGKPIKNSWKKLEEVPASTPVSDKIAKELKRIGFKFAGNTIIYAHMQATGMVNDHLVSCFRHREV